MNFWKYQGAGNDFVLLDQRQEQLLARQDQARIEQLCDRRFGIGGDGLILLEQHADYDFEMIYFNADGRESSMCGNGGRCIAAFAQDLGLVNGFCRFLAIDGPHEARIIESEINSSFSGVGTHTHWVELKMSDVAHIEVLDQHTYVLNTGSPHYIRFIQGIDAADMVAEGKSVRYSERFRQAGINVNLVETTDAGLRIRTYERGVEDETLACGTGVTAAALANALRHSAAVDAGETTVLAQGGRLAVRYKATGPIFHDIWLCGPAVRVFSGIIDA